MKRMIKTTFTLFLCIAAVFGTLGCAEPDEAAVVKDYEDTRQETLSVITTQSLSDDLWNTGFTAPDGTQIKVVEYSSDYYESENLSYRELVLKRLESNVDIDCYIIHAEDVIDFSRKNYWMDLSALEAVQSLSEDALKQSTFDGKVFSIPLSYTGFGFFWNVDMLKEHGLDVPGNIDEFLHVCQTLKEAGITPYLGNKGFALTVPAMAAGFHALYASPDSGRLLSELASGETDVSDYMTDGFQFIEMMIQKGYMDPAQALAVVPGEADKAAFLAGEGAFYCAALQSIEGADFAVQMTGVPVLKNGTVAIVGASSRMAVNPNSPNVEYAVVLLNELISPKWLADVAKGDKTLSSGKGEYDISYLDEPYRDFARLVQQGNQIPNQDFSLPFNTWVEIRDLCREICAGMSAAEAARAYDAIQREQIAAAQGS